MQYLIIHHLRHTTASHLNVKKGTEHAPYMASTSNTIKEFKDKGVSMHHTWPEIVNLLGVIHIINISTELGLISIEIEMPH